MKKGTKIVLIVIIAIILLGLIFFTIDYNRVRNQQKPIFCIPLGVYSDGGTQEYYGLGYKVIAFHKIEPMVDNEMEYYTKIHIGSWAMTYQSALEKDKNKISAVEVKNVTFVRTYQIIADLQKTDMSGSNNYYVVEKYQYDNPIVVRIDNSYQLEVGSNYEFTFTGGISQENPRYSMQEIFEKFRIIKIEKTDKIGLDQRQDQIN